MDIKDTKITANRQKKIVIVAKLNEKISTAKALIFTNYKGLTHKQLEGLKKVIKPMQADFVIAKNTLVLKALEENEIKLGDEYSLEGPTGTILIYGDPTEPLKALAKVIKELGIPSVKFGILDSKMLTGEDVLKISALPSKEILLTQLAFNLKSPIAGLLRALNWNSQKLVMTLNAISNLKPAQSTNQTSEPDATLSEVLTKEPEIEHEQVTIPVEENSTTEEVN